MNHYRTHYPAPAIRPDMDRDDMQPPTVNRINSFSRDISYPSSPSHDRHVEDTINSPFGHRRPRRQGTSDSATQTLRRMIPFHTRKRPSDEEHVTIDEKGPDAGCPAEREREPQISSEGALDCSNVLYEIISTRFWVPDEEDQEVVTLTVKDDTSDAITFDQFKDKVRNLPGLEDEDHALAWLLLDDVRKTCEKQFVHGRFLTPIVRVYDRTNPEEPSEDPKTATFISLPIFITDVLKPHSSTKDFEGHPVRALLQSRYRLDSTESRDKGQVIGKVQAPNDHVVHVPQIWALIINKNTIVTCAPLGTSTLRGDSIEIKKYADAQADEANWSMRFTDARGTVFHIPLLDCKTWSGLVDRITDVCREDEHNLIRDQLLGSRLLYQLWTEDGVQVTAESWPKMVENELIQLRLFDLRPSRAYGDGDSDEMPNESDSCSDCSSLFSSDDAESDATNDLFSYIPSFDSDEIAPAMDKLRSLREELEAMSQDDVKRLKNLKDCQIPALEKLILELIAADVSPGRNTTHTYVAPATNKLASLREELEQARSQGDVERLKSLEDYEIPAWEYVYEKVMERVRIMRSDSYETGLGSSGRRRRSASTSAEGGHPLGRRSRSESSSQPRLSRDAPSYTQDTPFPALDEPNRRTWSSSHSIVYGRARSLSQPHSILKDYSLSPRASRRQLYATSGPSRLATPRNLSPTGSLWDSVRSRVLNGKGFSAATTPILPNPPNQDIYFEPSDKRLASSRRGSLRVESGAGTGLSQSKGQATEQDSVEPALPGERENLASARESTLGEQERKLPDAATKGAKAKRRNKSVRFVQGDRETEPELKSPISRAHNEVPSLTSPHVVTRAPMSSPMVPTETQVLPIFLWSTEPEAARRLQGADQSVLADVAPDVHDNTSKAERMLGAIMLDMDSKLKSPKVSSVDTGYAWLYDKTAERTIRDVVVLREAISSDGGPIKDTGKGKGFTLLSSPESDTSISINSDETRKGPEEGLRGTSLALIDAAKQILSAFVTEGHRTPIVHKYWGAIHKIISQRNRDQRILKATTGRLVNILDLVRDIQMVVRTYDGSEQARYRIPRALPPAFQHLVMVLVLASSIREWSNDIEKRMYKMFDECENLLFKGKMQLTLMMHTDDYRESAGFQAVDSEALLSIIFSNLVSHLSIHGEFRLTEVYSLYTTQIQSLVRDQASVKVYDDIKCLREELDVIKQTLKQQAETLREFRRTIPVIRGVPSLSQDVINRILKSVKERIDDFDELQGQAETVRSLAAQSISLKAESNGNAIIVFTVVTIIFLPLSFVTSYLGMNTSDLRNMASTQTLFWAIGAPVAFVVLGTALAAAFYWTLIQRLTVRARRKKEKAE